jgi:hypothetical protein
MNLYRGTKLSPWALLIAFALTGCTKEEGGTTPVAPPSQPPPSPAPAAITFEGWSSLSGDGLAYGYVRNGGGTVAIGVNAEVRGHRCLREPCRADEYNTDIATWMHSVSGTRSLDVQPGQTALFVTLSEYCPPNQYCAGSDDYPSLGPLTWK